MASRHNPAADSAVCLALQNACVICNYSTTSVLCWLICCRIPVCLATKTLTVMTVGRCRLTVCFATKVVRRIPNWLSQSEAQARA